MGNERGGCGLEEKGIWELEENKEGTGREGGGKWERWVRNDREGCGLEENKEGWEIVKKWVENGRKARGLDTRKMGGN